MPHFVERTPSDDMLRDQAYNLIVAARATPSQENLDALTEWKNRSSRHGQILESAEEMLRTVPQGARRELNRREQLALYFELLWARWERHSGVLAGALAGAVVVVGVLLSNSPADPEPGALPTPLARTPDVYQSPHGQQREITLDDGSRIGLDWSSTVSVDYSPGYRRVKLTAGNAWFSVASNPSRPFIVTSGQVTTTVTGTQFAVQRYPGHVEVGVIEGSVAVRHSGGDEVQLAPAESVRARNGQLDGVKQWTDARDIGAWRDGVIILRGRPLLEALSMLAPYSRLTLNTSNLDERLLAPVSGTFFIERADLAIRSIIEAQGLETHAGSDSTLILSHPALSRQK